MTFTETSVGRSVDDLLTHKRRTTSHLRRRDFLKLAAAATALAACNRIVGNDERVAISSAATPATSKAGLARPADKTSVTTITTETWLAANRLMFGQRPGDLEHIAQLGLDGFIEEQLARDRLDTEVAERRIDAVPGLRDTLNASPRDLVDDKRGDIYFDLAQATLLRAVYSQQQLYELMVDFWSNHFNIFFQKNVDAYLKPADDRLVIRPHALGKFRDLLGASAHSPAMLMYLDNQTNRNGRPNENYARELMELHTVGVNGGYTQVDVQAVARAFTGWSVIAPKTKGVAATGQPGEPGSFIFRALQHDQEAKQILGIDLPANGGAAEGERVLDILAKHPSTATFISLKLARRFVSDQPPVSVVQLGAQAFTKSDGDVRATLGAILHSTEFKQSFGQKIKRPFELIASALRALDADTDGGRAFVVALRTMGQPLFGWAAPNGYPDVAGAWLGSSTTLARWNVGLALGSNKVNGTRVDMNQFAGQDIAALSQRLLGGQLPAAAQAPLQPFANNPAVLIGLMLSAPIFQVRG